MSIDCKTFHVTALADSVIKSIQRTYTTFIHNVHLEPAKILFIVFLKENLDYNIPPLRMIFAV